MRGAIKFSDEDVDLINEGEETEIESVELLSVASHGANYAIFARVAPLVVPAVEVRAGSVPWTGWPEVIGNPLSHLFRPL